MQFRSVIYLVAASAAVYAEGALAQQAQQAQQAQSPTALATPEELVRRGVAERTAGRDEAALALFEQAWEQGRSLVALAQIAVTEQSLGRWLPAERHLREALASGEHPYIQRNRAALEEAYATIRRRVGTLVVVTNVPTATVWIDGEQVTSAGSSERPEPLRVLVGAHQLEVRAERYYTVSRPIEITPDTAAREEATLRPIEVAPRADASTPPAQPTDPRPRGRIVVLPASTRGPRAVSWALWGGGLASLIVGVAGHLAREALAARYNSDCVGPDDPSRACASLRSDGGSMLVVSIAGYVVGAGLSIAGTIDGLIPRRAPASVSVAASGRGAQIAVGGEF